LRKVCKPQRFHGRQYGAESGQTIEQMAQEQLNRTIQPVLWQEINEVNGPVNLLLNL